MCEFFSFCGDGRGNYLYCDWEQRRQEKEKSYDSHTTILTLAGIATKAQDRYSKYEYNPLTKKFKIDCDVELHNHEAAATWAGSLDFKTVVPSLRIKNIVHPFKDKNRKKVSEKEIELLKDWIRVYKKVRDSVWASVWASVRASVWDSVWDSVRDSVWASVRDSVRDSVRAYISSFFDIEYKYDFSSCIKLWESGLVPTFDGKTWRLHGGKDAKILYEMKG